LHRGQATVKERQLASARMALFKHKSRPEPVAVSDPPPEHVLEEIGRLSQEWRAEPSADTERELLRLRHLAGVRLIDAGDRAPDYAAPDEAALPAGGLPEIAAADLTPGLLRAGILRDGCLLVRGLVPREEALALAAGIDRALVARDTGSEDEEGLYETFVPEEGYEVNERPWIEQGGGVLAADSPALATRMLDLYERAGLPRLVEGYLGERGLLSVHKKTLRKASPAVGGAWHQDGAFMGDARALNLWLSLSHCGDEAPGLDLVPRRLDEIVIEHDEMLYVDLTRERAAEAAAAGGVEIVRPIFEPGDALFFDEMFLHQTGSDPSMPNPRFAIESWFFGAHGFPADYAPLAV
jgi:Phytanoyl-CoA dioxygenase (PhyH)